MRTSCDFSGKPTIRSFAKYKGFQDYNQSMSRMVKIGGLVLAVGLLMGGGLLYALFHGYFDHGLFEVKQVAWSPSAPRRVAIVAERSDHEAMSSYVYFVLIADHVFSATELRRAYYSDDVVFAAASPCLNASWNDPHQLTVSCRNGTIDSAHINVRKLTADNVAITYVNIADATAKEFNLPNNDAMVIGFLIAGFAWTLWWNIDWQRYLRFYRVSGPPYRRSTTIAFRGFFALCSLGAAEALLRRLLERTRPAQFYLNAFLIAVAWLAVIVVMVTSVEWLAKHRSNVTVSQ